ncbi:MAG: hypothetical protein OXU61_11490 [Gammaproteobacteria bacterium]|nr:hypothetical protein [Gammaproteobacteria bacterium]
MHAQQEEESHSRHATHDGDYTTVSGKLSRQGQRLGASARKGDPEALGRIRRGSADPR